MEAFVTYVAFWLLVAASVWFILFKDMGTEPENPKGEEDEETQEVWRF